MFKTREQAGDDYIFDSFPKLPLKQWETELNCYKYSNVYPSLYEGIPCQTFILPVNFIQSRYQSTVGI